MAAFTEILSGSIAGVCWLIAALFFAPWSKEFLDKMDERGRYASEMVDQRMGRLFAAIGALCSAVAAISHVVVAYGHHLP